MPAGAPMSAPPGGVRERIAREALALCAQVDALAAQVEGALAEEDAPLQPLLAHRARLLARLRGHVAQLRHTAPAPDGLPEPGVDGVPASFDPLLDAVLAALDRSAAASAQVAAQVEAQVELLRGELDAMQRAAAATVPYGALPVRGASRDRVLPPVVASVSRLNLQG